MISKRFYNDHKAIVPMSRVQIEAKRQIEKKIESGQYVFNDAPCCICKTNSFEIIGEKDCYGLYCPVVICKTCGLVQQNPKMSRQSFNELHEKEYRDLYDGESDDSAAVNYFKYQLIRGEHIFNFVSSQSGIIFKGKRIVEIGCGAGGILQYFKDQGNEVFGIDPAADYIEYGEKQGLNLQVATLGDTKIPWQPDLVVYNNVVEHLIDPVAELKNLSKFLGKNTLPYIEVPNLKSLVRNYDSDLLKFIEIAHTFYFTPSSLKNMLHLAGYSFLKGSEGMAIRAIFTFSSQNDNNIKFDNEYHQTMSFLQNTERYRLIPTPTKIIFWAKKAFVFFLKKVGLFHWFFQKIYRKVTK